MKNDSQKLKMLAASINRILQFTSTGEQQFFNNVMVQDAVIRNFQVIGEAIKGLSAELRGNYPDVPWRNAAQFRDKITHDYLGVDLDIVWQTVEGDLPVLKGHIDKILAETEAPEQSTHQHESKLRKELKD